MSSRPSTFFQEKMTLTPKTPTSLLIIKVSFTLLVISYFRSLPSFTFLPGMNFDIVKLRGEKHYPKSAAMGFFSKRLKNQFETAVVNEPSVFEQLRSLGTWQTLMLDPYIDGRRIDVLHLSMASVFVRYNIL